jgi:hypothetical protein
MDANTDPVVGKIILNLHQSTAVSYSCPNDLGVVMRAVSQAFIHMAGSYLLKGPDFLRTALVVCALTLEAARQHQAFLENGSRRIIEAQPEPEPSPLDQAAPEPGKKLN